MSLYDKASIALIPSGTKASKLYSVLPANGDGDFTHSRSNTTTTRVNKDGLIENVGSNIPRLDYPLTNGVAGDCPHLLLEPSRTNRSQDTEAFQNWGGGSTLVTANQSVSPDGAVTADELTKTSSFSAISRSNVFPSSGIDVVFSVFVKEGTTDNITLRVAGSSNDVRRYFDLTNETSGSSGGNNVGFVSSKIEKYPNGWYRVSVICTIDSTTVTTNFYGGRAGNTTYDGEVYIWGSQIEEGDYISSYIPNTSGTTSTRSADLCNNAGTSAQVNNDAGAFFVEIQALEEGSSASRRITLSDESSNNRLLIETDESTGTFKFFIAGGGTVRTIATSTGNTQTDMNKLAIGYDGVNAKAYVNGTQVDSITNATTRTGMDTVDIADWNGTSNVYYGRVKQIIVFNEALSDSELATLTS